MFTERKSNGQRGGRAGRRLFLGETDRKNSIAYTNASLDL